MPPSVMSILTFSVSYIPVYRPSCNLSTDPYRLLEFSHEYLLNKVKNLLQEHKYLTELYSLGETEVSALEKIKPLIPTFSEWAKCYVQPSPLPDLGLMDYRSSLDPPFVGQSPEQPSVCISQLRDIEENVWSPRFGLKGLYNNSDHERKVFLCFPMR